MTDTVERIRKLLALAGNNPSRAEAQAAWDKAQALIAQRAKQRRPVTDAELAEWFVDAAAPCPWVILVSRNLVGREYPVVAAADMLTRNKQEQILPTWRMMQVPLRYRSLEPSEILDACYDGRIAWRSVSAAT
jgi:hypothetical protein